MPLNNKSDAKIELVAVIPAAGVGKRMRAQQPKQYLPLHGKTILEHTALRLLAHPQIVAVIIVLGADDPYFQRTSLAHLAGVSTVTGGAERVDSVLAGLLAIDPEVHPWVLVHDAARPCVQLQDISALIEHCLECDQGGLLAAPVRDTMKRGDRLQRVAHTVAREQLWHALTPQMYKTRELTDAIMQAQASDATITDESSAMELAGYSSHLIEARSDNIKITRQDDLALAEFILARQQENTCV